MTEGEPKNHPIEAAERSIERHIVTLEADKKFDVEIAGPADAETAVVLVHGFGVKRDSRGMFLDIEKAVADRMLSIRGDFSDITQEGTRAVPISTQAKRLARIIQFTEQGFDAKRLIYIGHSQGAITIAEENIANSKIILLAPPIESPYERFIKTSGWSRPGSSLDVAGESRLKRSDGSVTEVGADFWEDFKGVNAKKLYQQLARRNDVEIIFAAEDNVLRQEAAPAGVASRSVPGADHDFTGASRKLLLDEVLNRIKEF